MEQPTTEQPQLPNGAPPRTAYPPQASMGAYYAAPPTPPEPPQGMVPAVPPGPGRSTGFWVGLTSAIAVAVIAALLGGFFIGRSTRMSNEQVRDKLTQQYQADQIAKQQALNEQRTEMARRQQRLIGRVSAKAEQRGRREGLAQGREEGYGEGQASGFTQGQAAGYSQGQTDGYSSGLDLGACLASYVYC